MPKISVAVSNPNRWEHLEIMFPNIRSLDPYDKEADRIVIGHKASVVVDKVLRTDSEYVLVQLMNNVTRSMLDTLENTRKRMEEYYTPITGKDVIAVVYYESLGRSIQQEEYENIRLYSEPELRSRRDT